MKKPMFVFNARKFRKLADRNVRRALPESHLEVLDGMEVKFTPGGRFGKVVYKADGEDFYLDPVPREWCDEVIKWAI